MALSNIYLQDLLKQYENLNSITETTIGDLNDDQFNLRPQEKSWSVAECFDHLNTTWDLYKDRIQTSIEENKSNDAKNNDNYKPRFLFKKSTTIMEPPYKFKMKTFDMFIPNEKLGKDETLEQFNKGIDMYFELIERSENIDIKRAIVISPVSSRIKFQLGELFPFLAAHARRHIWQAENIKKLVTQQ